MYVDAYVDVLLVMVLQDQCLEGILSQWNLTGLAEGVRRSGSHGGILARRHFRATSGPLQLRVEHETCRTIHGTHLEGIFSQKNSNRMAGWVNRGKDPTEGFPRAGTLGSLLAP